MPETTTKKRPETVREVVSICITKTAGHLALGLKMNLLKELESEFWQIAIEKDKRGNLSRPEHDGCTNLTKKLEYHLIRIISRDRNYNDLTAEVAAHEFLKYARHRLLQLDEKRWFDTTVSTITTRKHYVKGVLHLLGESFSCFWTKIKLSFCS